MRTVHVLRKPVESTAAGSVLTYGTGALFIDGTRITCAPGDEVSLHGRKPVENGWDTRWSAGQTAGQKLGRWPTNLILQEFPDVISAFPWTQSGEAAVKRGSAADRAGNRGVSYGQESRPSGSHQVGYGDAGSAGRFFRWFKNS